MSSQPLNQFLVCGLGGLGQHCVVALKEFGAGVIAIEQELPTTWEIPNLLELLDDLIVGDCRQDSILENAKIQNCRAALIVTSNERANAEAALAVRQLNPQTRLVLRSSKENLNQLLSEQLGNFIAFEPTQLPAPTFAIAALGLNTLGFFNLEGQWMRVVQQTLTPEHRWCNARNLYDLNSRSRRLLACERPGTPPVRAFNQWQPETRVRAGDTVTYIETTEPFLLNSKQLQTGKRRWHPIAVLRKFTKRNLQQSVRNFFQLGFQQQVRRVAIACGAIVIGLLVIGTLLFASYGPQTTLLEAFYLTAVLLLGGYGDLFGDLKRTFAMPWWLQLFALGLTLAGTAFVGVLYALLTEALLSSKFQFAKHRPPIPEKNHVVLIGLGRVGQRVARILQEFRQSFVGISFNPDFDQTILPQMPLLVGNLQDALAKANLETAKSLVVATDDEILNLEAALTIRAVNPTAKLAIRTQGISLSHHLAHLLPDAQVLSTYAVTAEACAGAAFGENILGLFRFNSQTILVTEYQIEDIDTLHGLLLTEITYGYGAIPILHQKPAYSSTFMPSEDVKLAVGDRLIVLATSEALRRVELGKPAMHPKQWRVRVEKALTEEARFEGANAIARISDCPLATARALMNDLPHILVAPLYEHQAKRLVRELSKIQVVAKFRKIRNL
ncbi:MAG: NAD-binding protein [Cyanobacteriota bacterium]|nr:NAD-binding protein [Cyanobacteriota bacterium]